MRVRIVSVVLTALVVCLFGMADAALATPLSFQVTYDAAAGGAAVDGRILVIAADPVYQAWGYSEPRFAVRDEVALGPQFWGMTVNALTPSATRTLDGRSDVYGYPLPTVGELPEGDYWVQAVLNKYTTFNRADGFRLKLLLPQGVPNDNQVNNPGSLFSEPQIVHLSPAGGPVRLTLTQVVKPPEPVPPGGSAMQGNPTDSEHVKHVKIRSKLLSAFWGRDMYLAADVLLPSGYDDPHNACRKYPVIYWTFHYPEGNPLDVGQTNPGGFVEPPGVQQGHPRRWWSRDARFSQWWLSGDAPQVIYVQFREENPYGETAYQADSPNVGPYDTAEKRELVPALQKRFRIYDAGWARTCFGISSGGWMAAAQQIFHPRYYAGAWVFAPDYLSFSSVPLANMYEDDNFYYSIDADGSKVWYPGFVLPSGVVQETVAQDNLWEAALAGPEGHTTGAWGIDLTQAIWGPRGRDGYWAPAWDKLSGALDRAVVRRMKPKDLTEYTRANWREIGKDLVGKLHIYVGTKDGYLLNEPVKVFQNMADKLQCPKADFDFTYVEGAAHVWWPQIGPDGGLVGLIQTMAEAMKNAAPNTSATWWYR